MDFTFASNTEIAQTLGKRLAAIRLQRCWSQKELAARAGLSRNAIQTFETMGTTSLSSLIAMVRALGLEAELATLFHLPEPKSIAAMEAEAAGRRKRAPRTAKGQP
ncbi:helix-turn-helix domain-containing protein [Duganella sp. FT80W]|uniref:Helix-turn-helix domain-containing protein n=1 Tax=Duganella guangzhouensis TaxID=2666084 RepID=A0A6I2KZA2_9BURK|nr:helix-turn-helix transcriptional regulator [Duganella guangzhouensis]MRW91171.1 helix-turn-helix domain-containing protein [Duganella guangzhouensis]